MSHKTYLGLNAEGKPDSSITEQMKDQAGSALEMLDNHLRVHYFANQPKEPKPAAQKPAQPKQNLPPLVLRQGDVRLAGQ